MTLLPAGLLSLSGFLLFVPQWGPAGYGLLAVALGCAYVIDRPLLKDLILIAVGLVAMSAVPITPDVSVRHMTLMGTAMVIAVAGPYLLSRYLYRDHAIRFPVRTGQQWNRAERWYLPAVVVLGYLLLSVCMIPSGVYQN